MALQIAKRAGLKVACIADLEKHSERLYDLGADVLVDRMDSQRAINIIRRVTGGKLRFAFDTIGKDTSSWLQDALGTVEGKKSHLLGLTGLPKNRHPNIVYHTVPIKIFHDAPLVGETLMTWLEQLFLSKSLILPDIEIADGGLRGVNDALDRLRSGSVSAKRIVVPIEQIKKEQKVNGIENGSPPNGTNGKIADDDSDMQYFDELNSDSNRIKFAYWESTTDVLEDQQTNSESRFQMFPADL